MKKLLSTVYQAGTIFIIIVSIEKNVNRLNEKLHIKLEGCVPV